jgi:hypothetical protein
VHLRSLLSRGAAHDIVAALTAPGNFALWLRPRGWPIPPEADRGRVRALAWFAIGAQALFVIGWIVVGALESGYSPVRSFVSELGRKGAAHPWIFDVSVTIWGLGFIALAAAGLPALRRRRWGPVVALLFVLAGICAIADAPLRLDCNSLVSHLCDARRTAGSLSWRHYGHEWASFGVEVALALTPFALARAVWPGRLARLLLLGGAVVVVGRAATIAAFGELKGHHGLEQRLWLLVVHVWVLLLAAALIGETRIGRREAAGPTGAQERGAVAGQRA